MEHRHGEAFRRGRARDPRAGIGELVALVAGALVDAADLRGVRERLEQAICRIVRLRSARVHSTAMATGAGPMVREGGVVEVAVHPAGVLQAVADGPRRLDAWDLQVLQGAAHIAAIVLAIERALPAIVRTLPARQGLPSGGLVGTGPAMTALREWIARVAPSDAAVLIEGESGVGKELVARQIHDSSRRARMPFVAVNCAALVESLLEAELFGIEDRTATGVRGRRGKFELADGGSLFLDEIGDLSGTAQAKLLRVLQEMTIDRVGSHSAHRVDVRIIAATNRSLRTLVDDGRFRLDLYYRLSCLDIRVPPLRARRSDIPELVSLFLGRHADRPGTTVSPEAMEALVQYDWPGNVRELERVIQRAAILAESSCIALDDLPPAVSARYLELFQPALDHGETLRGLMARYVRLMLHRCNNNKREACRRLDISYHTLQAYLRFAVGVPAPERPASVPLRDEPETGSSEVLPNPDRSDVGLRIDE